VSRTFNKAVIFVAASMFIALCATIWALVYNSMFAGNKLGKYLAAPIVLTWIQFIGEAIQRNESGPTLVRASLQDFGLIANFGVGVVPLGILVGWMCARKGSLPPAAAAGQFVRMLPWGCAAMMLICTVMEIGLTLSRGIADAHYSGQLDMPDLGAYILGFAAILVNHKVMGPRTLRPLEITTC
jgi:hypothetical protein